MLESLRQLVSDDSGQGIVEYGLILGFIALVCIVAVTALGTQISAEFSKTANDV